MNDPAIGTPLQFLQGRHAIVTGGGTGIGAAIATALVNVGATVTVCGRRQPPLDALAGRSAAISAHVCDVTDETAVAALFERALADHGKVDIVVANAGAAESAPLHRTALSMWQQMLDVNLTGTFLTLREGMRAMKLRSDSGQPWGRLICVASNAGLKGYKYVAAYSAAKHGVIGLVRSVALEAAGSGITVNAICPGFTETPLLDASVDNIVGKTGASADTARGDMASMNPGGRLVQPEEIAAAVLWLVDAQSASVNGQAIEISGGAS